MPDLLASICMRYPSPTGLERQPGVLSDVEGHDCRLQRLASWDVFQRCAAVTGLCGPWLSFPHVSQA